MNYTHFIRFYTYLPGKPPSQPHPRTFIILPKPDTQLSSHFIPAHNSLALDEVSAHTAMFQGTSNDGYYDLGLQTAQAIRDAVITARGEMSDETSLSEKTKEIF
jgi:hypothetical protein